MQRRDFITLLGGAAAAWPFLARAQQPKRIGVLMGGAATEPASQSLLTIFVQGLRKLGWIEGQNLQIEVRWSAGDLNRTEAYANDLVGCSNPTCC
jgi:putative ABC transport system substrate-binding protein